MIIDINAHLMDEKFLTPKQRSAFIRGNIESEKISEEGRIGAVTSYFGDAEGKALLQEMGKAGVLKSVIFPADSGLVHGEPEVSFYEQNIHYSEVASNSGGRLIFFIGTDPRREDALDLFEDGVENGGALGLGLYPAIGYDPSEKLCFLFYSRAVEYDVPVVFLCAPLEGAGWEGEGCEAERFRIIAEEFPFMKIILANWGGARWMETVQLAVEYQNIFLEISALRHLVNMPSEFLHIMQTLRMNVGLERVLFGSGWPFSHHEDSLKHWGNALMGLPELTSQDDIPFVEEEVSAVLGRNAAGFLKIVEEG